MESLAFDGADQERFASLSGDRNPLHVDPVAARRLLTGRPVVHGVHTLLRLLNNWPDLPLPTQWQIEAEFLNPLSVGDVAAVSFDSDEGGLPRSMASTAGLACCRVLLRSTKPTDTRIALDSEAEQVCPGVEPLARGPQTWVGSRQSMQLPGARFEAEFPAVCARLGERRVAAIALLSSYVGMVCPGLHSIFSSLVVESGDDDGSDRLRFHVQRYDRRFGLFVVDFDGMVRGQLRAFLRAPAQVQPNVDELRPQVLPAEFAGGVHWVLGGSRGLGELVAKLLAAGDAQVFLSYATGAEDARRVVGEIAAAGALPAQAFRLDLLEGGIDTWLRERPWPDVVWYFPTPRIFRKRAGVFDAAFLDEFLFFYVRRFEEMCRALESGADGRRTTVFSPSTVFIDECPKGMVEYAMAKSAAEVLIATMTRTLRYVRPVAVRLPRLATDQTAGLVPGGASSNAEALLPVMRSVIATN
jgi:hypothetical protein